MPAGRPLTVNRASMTPEQRRAHDQALNTKLKRAKYVKHGRQIDVGDNRECNRCKRWLPRTPEFFYTRTASRHGLCTTCKACSGQQSKKNGIRRKYNGTRDEYEALINAAACAICGTSERLVMDHCHGKGHVRGILCTRCNTGLGHMKDDTTLLANAIAYLDATREMGAPLQFRRRA